ncbi:MAG TPA: hypothetical protein VG328_17905 [Stellaceae bacterium]|jgi:hypothetical protein|nr:hypothetical protein [Stellaceae bacterium]
MRSIFPLLAALVLIAVLSPALAAMDLTTTKPYKDRHGFALRVPLTASVETDAQENGQLDMIPEAAVVVSINPNEFKETNLGDASLSVGVSKAPDIVAACGKGQAAQGEKAAGTATLGGIKFSRFTFEDAGAGNRYASTIYRGVSDDNCYEVVEYLHWAAIENFSPGAVKEFDRPGVEAELNAIARSFAITGRPL